MTVRSGSILPTRASSFAALAALLLPAGASAVTVDGFKGQGLEEIYGSYAPAGDCKRQPLLVIDDRGFTFTVAGRTVTQSRVEYAVSYMGPEYDGIAKVFFPFPESDDEMGPIVMMVNDGERPGQVGFDSNLAPGQRLQPMHAALAGTRLARCAGLAPAAAVAAPARTVAPDVPAVPAEWTNLARMTGKYVGSVGIDSVDLLDKGAISAAIRAQLSNRFEALVNNLAVASPLQRQGSIYYVSGNAPHKGGEEQAYILIDPSRRAVQVGLWERGKLTVYAPTGARIPLPRDIGELVNRSPSENALALPGTPWELVPAEGRDPIAYVDAAGSTSYRAFSVFCENGQPVLAALTAKPLAGASRTITWNFAGGLVDVAVSRGNNEGTFWQASLANSALIAMLIRESGSAMLRLDGELEGAVSLAGSTQSLRTALRGCVRF